METKIISPMPHNMKVPGSNPQGARGIPVCGVGIFYI